MTAVYLRASARQPVQLGFDFVDEGEAARAVHGDDPDGLLHVVVGGELERSQRRLDVHGLHRGAQLVAVARQVGEA